MNCCITLRDIITWCISVAGIGIAWWQFASRMSALRKSRIKTQKETWFLHVIVLPSFPQLEEFYDILIKTLEEEIKYICESADNTNANAHNEMIAAVKANILTQIQDFFAPFQAIVESADPTIGKEIGRHMQSLQDAATQLLDNYQTVKPIDVKNIILQNKKKVLSSLNSSIRE